MFIPVTKLPDSLVEYLNRYQDVQSKPQQHHFQTYVSGLMVCEGKRTITNINATQLPEKRKDDSTHEKTGEKIARAGSFRAGGGYKWGKNMVSSLLRVGPFAVPYWGDLYLKKEYCEAEGKVFRTTTKMAKEQILSFEPLPGTEETCVLVDSWFSGWPIIIAVKSRENEGFYLICGLKKSRNIYRRDGSKVNLNTRASELERQHYEKVKANGRTFYVHRYEGNVSRAGADPCVVLICRNNLTNPNDEPFFLLWRRS